MNFNYKRSGAKEEDNPLILELRLGVNTIRNLGVYAIGATTLYSVLRILHAGFPSFKIPSLGFFTLVNIGLIICFLVIHGNIVSKENLNGEDKV